MITIPVSSGESSFCDHISRRSFVRAGFLGLGGLSLPAYLRAAGSDASHKLRWQVAKLWRKWLGRRNRGGPPNWEKFQGMLRVFPLTPARIAHSKL